MIEELTKDMVRLLREEQGMSLDDALRCVYTSNTYNKLINLNTGLYSQSTAYVYALLITEITNQKKSIYLQCETKTIIYGIKQ